jgi:TolB protein
VLIGGRQENRLLPARRERPRICVMDAGGGNLKDIGPGYDPALSPDGTKVVFGTLGAKGFRLAVMDATGGNVRELTRRDNEFGYVFPAWSPDGKWIAWGDKAGGAVELFVADAEGKNEKQLTRLGGINSQAAWSPDGKWIAFSHRSGPAGAYYVLDADGHGPLRTLLTHEPGAEGGRPAWRPAPLKMSEKGTSDLPLSQE